MKKLVLETTAPFQGLPECHCDYADEQRQGRRALPVLRRSHCQINAHPHQLLPR
jgi:hypothetical protein